MEKGSEDVPESHTLLWTTFKETREREREIASVLGWRMNPVIFIVKTWRMAFWGRSGMRVLGVVMSRRSLIVWLRLHVQLSSGSMTWQRVLALFFFGFRGFYFELQVEFLSSPHFSNVDKFWNFENYTNFPYKTNKCNVSLIKLYILIWF